MGETVLFGIVESIVCSTPVEVATATFYGSPFRLVFTGNLVPQLVELWYATASFDISAGGDVSKEFVRITRHLGMSIDGQDAHE